jgi:hypothetical protein
VEESTYREQDVKTGVRIKTITPKEGDCQLVYKGPVFCSLIMTALTSLSAVADDYSRLQLYILGFYSAVGFHSGLLLII